MQGLEPALGHPLADHPPSPHRHRETLERVAAQIVEREQPAQKPPRALGDDDGPGFGDGLQPGSQMQRLAHRDLLPAAFAGQVTHHQTSGDPDPHMQREIRTGPQFMARPDDGEPGAHRPFGGVFAGLRIAEIGEHPVAQILGDVTAQADDFRRAELLVGADDLAKIFRVESLGELGRAHQIAEQHGQLAPLGAGYWRRPCRPGPVSGNLARGGVPSIAATSLVACSTSAAKR